MVLKVLLGRARSGKSAWVLQRIKQTGDAAQSVLIVPEHASHAAELDLCRACGDGASRFAEVLTFKLLASRVLSLTGGSADVTLDNGGKLLLLQRVLQRLSSSLAVYRRPSRRSAFLQSLLGVMEELQAYAVDPQKLIEAAQQIPGDGGQRLHDTALIYAAYMADLTADGRDSRDRLEKLEQQLEDSHYIDGKDVYL
ncbi:MAG: ATP-dependent nuclease subunit B, partial [Oscillospiraceae bacterium]|nr:ATP-dependent nuclease subunit B [Oscillospiraceae bacterium]